MRFNLALYADPRCHPFDEGGADDQQDAQAEKNGPENPPHRRSGLGMQHGVDHVDDGILGLDPAADDLRGAVDGVAVAAAGDRDRATLSVLCVPGNWSLVSSPSTTWYLSVETS